MRNSRRSPSRENSRKSLRKTIFKTARALKGPRGSDRVTKHQNGVKPQRSFSPASWQYLPWGGDSKFKDHGNGSITTPKKALKTAAQKQAFWMSTLSAFCGFFIALVLVGSSSLALPFMAIGATFPYLNLRRKRDKELVKLSRVWPELLDHMISGLRSGLSLAETISGLARRGPEISRHIFAECEMALREGRDLSVVFQLIKARFNDPIADQVCEVLDFSRGTGSRDTALTLRTLGDFIRSDIAVRGEISAKLGWVKNSAGVAAIAPWILLVILSAQPSTVAAFSTGTGIGILIIGLAMCGLAYFWMSKVGRVEEVPRIFPPKVIS